MVKLSIITVAYNCLGLLEDCLKSVQNCNDLGEGLEIIVVDNGSDGTYEALKNSNLPGLKVIREENRGFGAGNNAGAEIASGKYLLFLNPDTVITEPVFSFAVDKFNSDSALGCFGIKMLDADGNSSDSTSLRFYLGFWRHQLNRVLTKLGIYLPDRMYTSGAGLYIRADVFRQIGGFDEELFMYCEEPDICNRVNRAGYKCGYFPEKSFVHLEGRTSDEGLASKYFIQLRAWKYYCGKYGINFDEAAIKEKNYCSFKSGIFKIMGRKEKSEEYARIASALENYLNGGEL